MHVFTWFHRAWLFKLWKPPFMITLMENWPKSFCEGHIFIMFTIFYGALTIVPSQKENMQYLFQIQWNSSLTRHHLPLCSRTFLHLHCLNVSPLHLHIFPWITYLSHYCPTLLRIRFLHSMTSWNHPNIILQVFAQPYTYIIISKMIDVWYHIVIFRVAHIPRVRWHFVSIITSMLISEPIFPLTTYRVPHDSISIRSFILNWITYWFPSSLYWFWSLKTGWACIHSYEVHCFLNIVGLSHYQASRKNLFNIIASLRYAHLPISTSSLFLGILNSVCDFHISFILWITFTFDRRWLTIISPKQIPNY